MSKNMTRKGLAFGTGLALVATGLVSAPAQGAAGDLVTLVPSTGSKYGTFISDSFSLTSYASNQLNATNTAFKIDNADQNLLEITIQGDSGSDGVVDIFADQVDLTGLTAQGVYVDVSLNQSLDTTTDDGTFLIDMEDAGIVSLIISDIQDGGARNYRTWSIDVQPLVGVNNTSGTAEVQATAAALTVTNSVAYVLDLPGEAAVTYTSDSSATLAEISAGLDALVNAQGNTATISDDGSKLVITYLAADGDVGLATLTRAGSAVTIEETVEGEDTGAFNFASDEDHVFDVNTAADTYTELAYGAGDQSVRVTSWVESETPLDFETVDVNYASLSQTVTWFDPKGVAVIPAIERIVTTGATRLNDVGNALTASIQFNKDINLAQFDKSMWTEQVTTTGLPAFSGDSNVDGTALVPAGLGTNPDRLGRYVFDPASVGNVVVDTTYTLNVHSKMAEAASVTRWFSSTGYSISGGTAVSTMIATPSITDTTDVDYTAVTATSGADNFATATIRAGVKSVTYTAQLQSGSPLADSKTASVPTLVIVRSGSFLPTGSSFTVGGNASPITRGSEARIVTGFTNSDGKFSVTVNSAVAAKDENYTVDFYVLRDGVFRNLSAVRGGGGTDINRISATYASATAGSTSLAAVKSVVAGADVTVEFEVTDQFGSPISQTATGRQLSVSLVAPNKGNLELNATVPTTGLVKFTFKNYLAVGGSDLLTATLYTGSASDPTTVDTAVVTLYNTGATGAVQVPESLIGVITYRDFIADGAKVVAGTTVDPDNDITFTGTVVDANGVGIPAAVVTIDAPGMQIQDGDRYYVGKRTTNANAAGVFTVTLNAQKVNTAGTRVTVTTADGKTASTLVRTYFPEDGDPFTAGTQPLNGNVLDFKLSLPATVLVNTTYAVKATLHDKWGNPVRTSSATNAVDFLGVGSVQINGSSNTVSRQFDANGEALVYVRSVKDIAGPGTISAELKTGEYTYWDFAAGATATKDIAFATVTTNVTSTAWDETKFVNAFSNVVEVLESAPTTGKVNVGSFNGKLVVYALGLDGSRISWKVGGNWGTARAVGNTLNRFDRPTPRRGVTVSVEIYVDGVLQLTKSVVTR